jgi:hypothetical protein
VSALWLLPAMALALIMVSEGNRPVQDMGWPTGAEAVANLPSRLGYKEGPGFGGGEYYFEYQCKDTAEFNDALKKFGAIRVPRTARRSLTSFDGQMTSLVEEKPLLLVVHDWPRGGSAKSGAEKEGREGKRVDWTFTVWVPESFHRLFSNPKGYFDSDHPHFRQPVPAPRIDAYIGGAGPIVWEKVEVPANVRVLDQRAAAAPTGMRPCGLVSGGVYDMATHRVIAGADVILVKREGSRDWTDAARTKTDANGQFEIVGMAEGYYEVRVRAESYAGRNFGAYHNRTGHDSYDFDALLQRAASLTGRVTDKKGNPVAGVQVSADGTLGIDGLGYQCADEPSTTTDARGRFALRGLPEGFTRLRCRAPSLHQETSIFELYSVSTKPWEKPQDIALVVTGTGIVRGKVVDADGKPPTRGFVAEIEPKGGSKIGSWGGSMQCKKDGSFEFQGVPPGEYVVVVRPNPGSEGEASAPKPVTVTAGETADLKFVSDYARSR